MIYSIFSTIISIILLPVLFVLNKLNLKLGVGFKEKTGNFNPNINNNKKSIIFYGISVGEILALEQLIKTTKSEFPNHNIIVTTATKTGQGIAHKKLDDVVDYITYFPYDFTFCIDKFLSHFHTDAVLIAETELWPNFAYMMNKKNIPLYIVNGRISDRTYKSYKKLSFFFAHILKKYTKILTQSEEDNKKLISIGANSDTTQVMGNLKFDIMSAVNVENNLIEKNNNDKIIVAGSTHTGEDEIILEVYKNVKKENVKLLIAPRHPERNDYVYKLCQDNGFKTGKRSLNDDFKHNDIILLDTMGELGKMYSICHFAFIGGSFNKTGGHNPLEATIYNKPVISGKCIHNFKDIYGIITRYKAGTIVNNTDELTYQMDKLLNDEEYYKSACEDCKLVFDKNRGAVNRVIDELKNLINM